MSGTWHVDDIAPNPTLGELIVTYRVVVADDPRVRQTVIEAVATDPEWSMRLPTGPRHSHRRCPAEHISHSRAGTFTSIHQKLEVATGAQAVAETSRRGIVTAPGPGISTDQKRIGHQETDR